MKAGGGKTVEEKRVAESVKVGKVNKQLCCCFCTVHVHSLIPLFSRRAGRSRLDQPLLLQGGFSSIVSAILHLITIICVVLVKVINTGRYCQGFIFHKNVPRDPPGPAGRGARMMSAT